MWATLRGQTARFRPHNSAASVPILIITTQTVITVESDAYDRTRESIMVWPVQDQHWRASACSHQLGRRTDSAYLFATYLLHARGNRLCDPNSTLFLGSETVAGTGRGPVAWVGAHISGLDEIVFLGDGATPLVASNTLCPGHVASACAAPPIPASPCPKTVK